MMWFPRQVTHIVLGSVTPGKYRSGYLAEALERRGGIESAPVAVPGRRVCQWVYQLVRGFIGAGLTQGQSLRELMAPFLAAVCY
jgi:hypothetical protein